MPTEPKDEPMSGPPVAPLRATTDVSRSGATIAAIDVFDVRLPVRRDWRWRGMHEQLGHWSIVRVVTDDGTAGWGEATALGSWGGDAGRYFGETPTTVRHVVEDLLRPALVGLDSFGLHAIHAHMEATVKGHVYAKAAVEMALFDIEGKLTGLSVADLLGGRARDSVPIAHMIGLMDAADVLNEVVAAGDEGVSAFQIKGTGDADHDVELVRAVRRYAPADAILRLDANQGYRHMGAKAAVRTVRRLEAAGADMVEQPMEGIVQMAAVRREVEATIVADESCWQPCDLLEIARVDAADAISIYLAKSGGLHNARRVADLAATLGLPCDVNGSLESGIGNAANVQFALANPAVTLACVIPVTSVSSAPSSSVAGRYFSDDLVSESFRFEDGRLHAPPGPGLGICVDEEKLARYCA